MTTHRPAVPDVTLADCLRVADALGYELRIDLAPHVELGDAGPHEEVERLAVADADALIVKLDTLATENRRLSEENASLRRTIDAIRAAVPR